MTPVFPKIDTHVHLVDPKLPGSKVFPDVYALPWMTADAVAREYAPESTLLAMGRIGFEEDPLGTARTKTVAAELVARNINVHLIGSMSPTFGYLPECMRKVEAEMDSGSVVALKAYLGYVHAAPDDQGYDAYYRLATKYQLPVIFHTGDTHSTSARLKFAHPLGIDDVAARYPALQIVIAHMGNPWCMDAAAVMYKNENVWADLSGIVLPPTDATPRHSNISLQTHADEAAAARLRDALSYTEAPERFLFGTDWPLVHPYSYFSWLSRALGEMLPDFDANARRLFRLP